MKHVGDVIAIIVLLLSGLTIYTVLEPEVQKTTKFQHRLVSR